MSINERIKYIRKSNKLSQILFSEALNVKQATLSQIENGVIMPSLDVIKSIIGKFNISYEWLIDGEGSMLKEEKAVVAEEKSDNVELMALKIEYLEKMERLREKIDKLETENKKLRGNDGVTVGKSELIKFEHE